LEIFPPPRFVVLSISSKLDTPVAIFVATDNLATDLRDGPPLENHVTRIGDKRDIGADDQLGKR
jgi:hypothetical protein